MKEKFYCDCGSRRRIVPALRTNYMVTDKIPECPECHVRMNVIELNVSTLCGKSVVRKPSNRLKTKRRFDRLRKSDRS